MNSIEQLEALNPAPEYRGNPGHPDGRSPGRSKSWLLAAVAAAAIVLVVAGSFAMRRNDAGQLDLQVASQIDEQPEQDSPAASELAPSAAITTTDGTEAVARLVMPEIDVDVIVVEGVDIEALRKGPGHYPNTAWPGQAGNAAIAGHRTTYGAPFHRLDELVQDDAIFVTTAQGIFEYRVVETMIVDPTNVEVLEDAGDNRLTLTANHPKYTARQKIIVSSELVGAPAATVDLQDLQPIQLSGEPVAELSGLVEMPSSDGEKMLAQLLIPEIDVDVTVVEGVTVNALRSGPGHYPDTPLPGQAGNAAIAGHRTSSAAPFERLDEIVADDRIFASTQQGIFEYQVTETLIVEPTDTAVLDDFGDNRLTLTTTHPENSIRERIVVVAQLIGVPAPPVEFDSLPVVAQLSQPVIVGAPDIRWDNYQDADPPYYSFHGNTDPLQSAQAFVLQYHWGAKLTLHVYEQTLRAASVRWIDEEHDTAGWVVLSFEDGRYWVEDMTTDGIEVDMDGAIGGGGSGYIQSDQQIEVEVDRPVRLWLDPDRPVPTRGPLLFNLEPLLVTEISADQVDQRVPLEFAAVEDDFREVRFIFRNQDGEQIGAAISSLADPSGGSIELITSLEDVDALHDYLRNHPEFVDDWFTFDRWQSVEWVLRSTPQRAPETVDELPLYRATRVQLNARSFDLTTDEERQFAMSLFDKFHVDARPRLADALAQEKTITVDVSSPAAGYVVDELPAASQCVYQAGSTLSVATINEVRGVSATPEEAIRSTPLALEGSVIEFTDSDGIVLGYAQAFDGRPWTFRKVIAVEQVDGGWVVDRWDTTGC